MERAPAHPMRYEGDILEVRVRFTLVASLCLSAVAGAQGQSNLLQPVPVMGRWSPQLYGFVEFDAIYDSTQSFNELAGNTLVARPGTYAGDHGRLTFSPRHSRLGFRLIAPEFQGMRASAVLEVDFLNNVVAGTPESVVFTGPSFRIRHAMLRVDTDYVDLLFGQSWELFGWQPAFLPDTLQIQGVPGQIYSRAPQIRISRTFRTAAINVEAAVAVSRAPQRDAFVPDGQAGVRLLVNGWKGMRSSTSLGMSSEPLSVGVSAVVRRFVVPEFSATPVRTESAVGWGVSVDAFLPIIPRAADNRANGLTLTGSFVRGAGIADLYTSLGGPAFPALPNPSGAVPAPIYTANIDPGLVSFTPSGQLETVGWTSFLIGLQYFLPPRGRCWIALNYSELMSGNTTVLSPFSPVLQHSRWAEANALFDLTPAVRLGLGYAFFQQRYTDGLIAHNHRGQLTALYIF